jgi:hypothetical protein
MGSYSNGTGLSKISLKYQGCRNDCFFHVVHIGRNIKDS